MVARNFLTMITILAIGGVTVTGCGRKAGLDTPYAAALEAREQAQEEDRPLPPRPEPPANDRPFILDGLID